MLFADDFPKIAADSDLIRADDIHYVKTISATSSISIHLLANDTACVWRDRFDPASGAVTPFRSGYANAPCPADESQPSI